MATTTSSSRATPPLMRRGASTASGPCDPEDISSPSTADASPADSPRPSASSTSLSSLASAADIAEADAAASKKAAGHGRLVDTYGNVFEVPDFTIKEIHDVIPKHCFERSGLRGLGYVARDVVCLATTFYLFNTYVTPANIPSTPARTALWALYTGLQGLFATGLWVLAHECGHQAFSTSKALNDSVGWVLHSALLVPYFSWKISHSKHHKATGHMERDMVFLPQTRQRYAYRTGRLAHELSEMAEDTPIWTFFLLMIQQIIGWPNYLMTNITGHNYHQRQREGRGKGKRNGFFRGVNHFNPESPIFDAKDAKLVLLSDLGLAISVSMLTYLVRSYGWANMLVWYFAPYLWVNHWLVAITFLQHTDPSLPHYTGEEWTFVRGAAATIDREFGFIGRTLFHGIIETHVLHHYISTIPFYHADEASEAIRPVMGRHYRSNTRGGPLGFLRSLFTTLRWCQWVEPNEDAEGKGKGVLFFRNVNSLGIKPARMEKPAAVVA